MPQRPQEEGADHGSYAVSHFWSPPPEARLVFLVQLLQAIVFKHPCEILSVGRCVTRSLLTPKSMSDFDFVPFLMTADLTLLL